MNPRLVIASTMPHASTRHQRQPVGSISAMNTPPRKLLNVVKRSSASRPGTRRTARIAPRMSMTRGAALAAARGRASGMRIVRRCAAASAVSAIAIASVPAHAEQADGEAAEHAT